MGLAGDEEDVIYKKYQDVCKNLNMDSDTVNNAWETYTKIKEMYTLEGDHLHWLGCALYVACRKATPSTVSKADTLIEGNLVSLSSLLKHCKLRFTQFVNKFKRWSDMANIGKEFQVRIERLTKNFAVSTTTFKKFKPIFVDMFIFNEPPRQQKTKKQRNIPCSVSKLFNFTWTLFVCVKAEIPAFSDDLVNSYHLLLSCCDLIFFNAVLSDRRDLLNPSFPGLPKDYHDDNYQPPSEPQCIIHDLCQNHDGIATEAKSIKEYCWKAQIRKLFEKKVLKGDSTNFSDLLEPSNFDQNFKNVNKMYEEYVLSVGDIDERLFMEDENNELGTPSKIISQSGIGDFAERLQAKKDLNFKIGNSQPLLATPLTGRIYLRGREGSTVTPVSTATQSVSRLQNMLNGRQACPSENLRNIISLCADNPGIEQRVQEMGALFCSRYSQSTAAAAAADDQSQQPQCDSQQDFARNRLQLAVCLYYKLLDNIISEEIKRTNFDCNHLLNQSIFHLTMFACCLEIVIYSYNSQRTFPWVLEALNIEPYHFYKVIEIIVRAEDQLSRDMVKHLNMVEEQILESLAWKNSSPLWEILAKTNQPVPSCEDVSLPSQLQDHMKTSSSQNGTAPKSDSTKEASTPVASVSERFQSPLAMSIGKRPWRLVEANSVLKSIKPGQSLLQLPNNSSKVTAVSLPAGEEKDVKKYIPITISGSSGSFIIQAKSIQSKKTEGADKPESSEKTVSQKENKPKRTGSLALFFRKFYHLASVRMHELCNQLNLMDTEQRRKIWTCFEHSIVENIHLMIDRHLDQIIMCSVYVICKVVGPDRTFTEVMKCYRLQPQCNSNVYRNVLLTSDASKTNAYTLSLKKDEAQKEEENNEIPQQKETRGDLIKFYNTVYVRSVQPFVLRFNQKGRSEELTLSPLLVGKSTPMSPRRRVSEKHSVYIRPLATSESVPPSPNTPIRSLSYCFSRSPAKDLRAINTMIQVECNRKIGKRLLDENEEVTPAKRPACQAVNRKMADIFVDRLCAKKTGKE
ncbi:retinoblastoma-like protein 1 [Nilaparvata lugens]|uniref:retinoblastoma-like protein 1 n=1 Tax=Nilaparvata lugens TaxID=108931 RepID=UPI00193E8A9C|nr:retinoblastoma-like protein 1 [Nilaparvata lugens]